MKKFFLFAALAGIVFASCQKEATVASVAQNEGQQEITFTALSKAMTKGVLGSGGFATDRTIQVAGTMKSGDKFVDFLEAKTFARKGSSGNTWQASKWNDAENKWDSDPVYYPIGVASEDFHFLAYSETTPKADGEITEATFARWYGSNEVELQVNDCAKNEIVYSGFKGEKTNNGGVTNATFARTQALVTVKIMLKDVSSSTEVTEPNDLIINKIGFEDVKTSGTLLLKYDATATTAPYATAQWVFNAGCTCHFAEMGNYNLGETCDETPWTITADSSSPVEFKFSDNFTDNNKLGQTLTTTGYVLDRLFPAQKLGTETMVINYTLGDLTTDVKLKLSEAKIIPESGDSTEPGVVTWNAGKRYVYIITVNVNEILISPNDLGAWEVTTIEGQYDSAPITS